MTSLKILHVIRKFATLTIQANYKLKLLQNDGSKRGVYKIFSPN